MSYSSSKRSKRSYYPTQWSKWEWNDSYNCYARYRLKAPDEYEYEYEQAQSSNTPRTTEEPSLDPIPETYPSQKNYTTTPDVSSITQGLSQATLGPNTGSYSSQDYTASLPTLIRTRNPHTDREEFDPHYKVHGAWAFKWGRIFKVLWAEPKGAEGGGSTGQSGTESVTIRKGKHGEETFAKVRRFVIIKAMDGHCICLPILTYSGQGVNKRGVHAEHHAIIYSGRKPVAFRGEKEKGLTMRSIRVSPETPRHKLDDASRLNYAKTYTVECNVKVWFIGKVHSDSEWQIRTDYNRVHPPLEIKGLRPPDTPEDTYLYAQGGTATYGGGHSNSYGSSPAPYSSSYPSGTSYMQPSSSGYGPSYNMNTASSSSGGYGPGAYYGSHGTQPGGERYDLPPVDEHEDGPYPDDQPHGKYDDAGDGEHEGPPPETEEKTGEEDHGDIYGVED